MICWLAKSTGDSANLRKEKMANLTKYVDTHGLDGPWYVKLDLDVDTDATDAMELGEY